MSSASIAIIPAVPLQLKLQREAAARRARFAAMVTPPVVPKTRPYQPFKVDPPPPPKPDSNGAVKCYDLPIGPHRMRMTHWVQVVVAREFEVSVDDLISSSLKAPLPKARQIAFAISHSLTNLSLPEIGRQFGHRHHTTILHAVKRLARTEVKTDYHDRGAMVAWARDYLDQAHDRWLASQGGAR